MYTDKESGFTKVSNIFIDEYMTSANGDYVKIYLYLLRCMNMSDCHCSVTEMADRFDYTENDIRRALNYWEKMNLIKLEYDSNGLLNGICLIDSSNLKHSTKKADSALSEVKESKEETSSAKKDSSLKKDYAIADLENFKQNSEVATFLFCAEQYIGKPLSLTDIRTIYYWYDALGFPCDVIEYLVELSVSKGKKTLRYMDKIALAWHEKGVRTLDDAKRISSSESNAAFAVMRYLGINGRNLIDSELKLIDKWVGKYGFTLDIVEEACRRTVSATSKPSFEYTDRILTSWHDEGVKHFDDIKKADETFKASKAKKAVTTAALKSSVSPQTNRFNNFEQRNYNFEELEQLISYNGRK